MYQYKCKFIRVIDGDTVALDIDLGFNVWLKMPVRLGGINAPELRGKTALQGQKSKDFLTDLFNSSYDYITVETQIKDKDKYGRVLGVIKLWKNSSSVIVNEEMINSGNAVVYED